ncbi:MAG: hypothetical protein HRU18_16780 [Pseudoalteromonas sp.]|uniref:hypothetical protein n=1 Tax=Pseudoalteromonas sp. TaxID=53249 RepID=UPI001D9BF945|nr:hypothetical protein [Pseudoalteromonas sp.]NRA79862.1 hypothetical protein [Pseudoalteromonas sp.]
MARPSKLDNAKKRLVELINGKEINFDQFMALLAQVTTELDLNEAQQKELIDASNFDDKTIEPDEEPLPELTADQKLELMQKQIDKLEEVISRLAVNTGNGNWLREHDIKRWEPKKKHMSVQYT